MEEKYNKEDSHQVGLQSWMGNQGQAHWDGNIGTKLSAWLRASFLGEMEKHFPSLGFLGK